MSPSPTPTPYHPGLHSPWRDGLRFHRESTLPGQWHTSPPVQAWLPLWASRLLAWVLD